MANSLSLSIQLIEANFLILVQISASFVALCGAILTSIALIAIRKLQGVNFLVPVFYVGLSSVVLTTGAILASGSFQSVICGRWHEWFLLGLGICGLGKCMEGGCAVQPGSVY